MDLDHGACMYHVWDCLGCLEMGRAPGSGVCAEVEVRLSNRKAVGSGYDGFEGKEGLDDFFWISGRRICAMLFSPFSLSLQPLCSSSQPIHLPLAHRHSQIQLYCYCSLALFLLPTRLPRSLSFYLVFLPRRNKILSHF